MQVKFYKSPDKGDVVVKVYETNAPVKSPDGLEELVPDSTDGATEKHVPVVEVSGNHLHVNIGSADHPMEAEHYIQMICLVTEQEVEVHTLEPGNAPHTDFYISEGDQPIAVYEYCNIHGLWVNELAVTPMGNSW